MCVCVFVCVEDAWLSNIVVTLLYKMSGPIISCIANLVLAAGSHDIGDNILGTEVTEHFLPFFTPLHKSPFTPLPHPMSHQ